MAAMLGAREETECRRLRGLAVALVLAGVISGHNIIVVRNWDNTEAAALTLGNRYAESDAQVW